MLVSLALAASSAAAAQGGRVITTGPADSGVEQPGGMVIIEGPGYGGAGVFVGGPAAPPPGAPARMEKVTYLGVSTEPASEALGEQLKLPRGTGLVVEFVDEDGPAAKAGIRRNDVLLRLNDQVLVNPPQLAVLVRLQKPGDKAALVLLREAKEQKVTADLAEKEMAVGGEAGRFELPRAGPVVPPQASKNLADILRRRVPAAAPGVAASSAVSSSSDGEHTLTVTTADGKKRLVAKDKEGKVLFEGPIDTPQERAKVPAEVGRKLERMERSTRVDIRGGGMNAVGAAQVFAQMNNAFNTRSRRPEPNQVYTDDEHTLTLTTRDAQKYLTAQDKSGKVVFEGFIGTEKNLAKVPPDIRRKLDAMAEKVKADSRGEVSLIEDGMTVTLTTELGRQHVVAKDKDGKVVFDGPADTEDERARMSPAVRKAVEKLWRSCAAVWAASGD